MVIDFNASNGASGTGRNAQAGAVPAKHPYLAADYSTLERLSRHPDGNLTVP